MDDVSDGDRLVDAVREGVLVGVAAFDTDLEIDAVKLVLDDADMLTGVRVRVTDRLADAPVEELLVLDRERDAEAALDALRADDNDALFDLVSEALGCAGDTEGLFVLVVVTEVAAARSRGSSLPPTLCSIGSGLSCRLSTLLLRNETLELDIVR